MTVVPHGLVVHGIGRLGAEILGQLVCPAKPELGEACVGVLIDAGDLENVGYVQNTVDSKVRHGGCPLICDIR